MSRKLGADFSAKKSPPKSATLGAIFAPAASAVGGLGLPSEVPLRHQKGACSNRGIEPLPGRMVTARSPVKLEAAQFFNEHTLIIPRSS